MLCAAIKREARVALFFDLKRMMRIDGARSPRAAYSLWVHRLGLHHPHVVPPWFALLYSLSRYPQPVALSRPSALCVVATWPRGAVTALLTRSSRSATRRCSLRQNRRRKKSRGCPNRTKVRRGSPRRASGRPRGSSAPSSRSRASRPWRPPPWPTPSSPAPGPGCASARSARRPGPRLSARRAPLCGPLGWCSIAAAVVTRE